MDDEDINEHVWGETFADSTCEPETEGDKLDIVCAVEARERERVGIAFIAAIKGERCSKCGEPASVIVIAYCVVICGYGDYYGEPPCLPDWRTKVLRIMPLCAQHASGEAVIKGDEHGR